MKRSTILAVAVTAILLGCASLPDAARPVTTDQQAVLYRAQGLWLDAGLPHPGDCARPVAVVVDDAGYAGHGCTVQPPTGCLRLEDEGPMFATRTVPVVVMHESAASDRLLVHETMHWWARCLVTRWPEVRDGMHGHPGWFNAITNQFDWRAR